MQNDRIIRNTFYAQLSGFVLVSLTQTLGQIIDGVLIGRCLGVESMAAFGIVNPLMVVLSLFGAVIASGSRNRFTRLVGSGKIRQAQGMFSLSCVLSVAIAAGMTLGFILFATPVTRLMGASGNAAALLPKARAYLIGIVVGLPAMNIVRNLSAYMGIDSDGDLPVIAAVVLTGTDVALDLIVIFVLHGDIFGMGLATSLSYYAAAGVLLTHFRKKNILLRFSFKDIPWRETGGLLAHGAPMGACRLGNTVRCAFMNRLLGVIAASGAIAAYSVHLQADSLLNPLTIGMADTVAVLAGVLMGEEDRPMMKRLLYTSVRGTLVLTLSLSVLSWFLAPLFASLYIRSDPEVLRFATRAVRCYAVGMPLYGLNAIFQDYLQGIGRTRLSTWSGFLLESGFLMLSAAVMAGHFGADAVWYAFPAAQVLMVLYYGVVIAVESRRLGIRREELWDRVLLLPDTFDVADEDRMDRSITTIAEVTELSGAVWSFCEAHGCDPRRRYLMSLSVEEMASNVIQHGFTKDRKSHSVDVRVLKKGEEYIVRIRDDCRIFDPVKQLALYTDDDPAHHMGLRMIINMAKEVRYTCVLKLNDLLVKV